jgi:superfamily II DNA helicase RecQ
MNIQAERYLKQMFGDKAIFRKGQKEAIELAMQYRKVILVQQTGWGKVSSIL